MGKSCNMSVGEVNLRATSYNATRMPFASVSNDITILFPCHLWRDSQHLLWVNMLPFAGFEWWICVKQCRYAWYQIIQRDTDHLPTRDASTANKIAVISTRRITGIKIFLHNYLTTAVCLLVFGWPTQVLSLHIGQSYINTQSDNIENVHRPFNDYCRTHWYSRKRSLVYQYFTFYTLDRSALIIEHPVYNSWSIQTPGEYKYESQVCNSASRGFFCVRSKFNSVILIKRVNSCINYSATAIPIVNPLGKPQV